MKHTPGPWEAELHPRYKQWNVFKDGTGDAIFSASAMNHRSAEQVEANVRVATAAPELLEELETLYIWLADYTHEWPGRSTMKGQARLSCMRSAIAKATGRTERDVQDDYGTRAAIAARGSA